MSSGTLVRSRKLPGKSSGNRRRQEHSLGLSLETLESRLLMDVSPPDIIVPGAIELTANHATITVNSGDIAMNQGTYIEPSGITQNPAPVVTLTASYGTVAQTPDYGYFTWSGTWDWSAAGNESLPVTITAVSTAIDPATGEPYTNTITFSLVVPSVNQPPTVAPDDAVAFVDEGQTAVASGSFADANPNDTVTLAASIGTVTRLGTGNTGNWVWDFGTNSDHQSQTVTITATDSGGLSTSTTFDLVVNNVAPTVAPDDAVAFIDEGQTAMASGSFADVDPNDTVTLNASIGTVTQLGTGNTGNWIWSFGANNDSQSQTVTITATDDEGASSTTTFDLVVNNVAPTVNGATFVMVENSPNGTVVGQVVASDPGNDIATYSIVGGTGQTAFAINPGTGQITVADSTKLDFEKTTAFALQVRVADNDGATGTAMVNINLLNQASISGAVFEDVNKNGLYDANELGIDGVTIQLLDANGKAVRDAQNNPITAITSHGGLYLFEDLNPGVYRIHELQPTGVNDNAEILGNLGGTIITTTTPSSGGGCGRTWTGSCGHTVVIGCQGGKIVDTDTMQLTLARIDATGYDFAEYGQTISDGDTATIAFWNGCQGQSLIKQGGAALANWLTATFGNIFGNTFVGANATGNAVATFYRTQLYQQMSTKCGAISAEVDAQFMSVALASYFTNTNLAGTVGAAYGFHVTDTGLAYKLVNVGSYGAAFGVANNSTMAVGQLLAATNAMTDVNGAVRGFAHIYDQNGDNKISSTESKLRTMADQVYTSINEQGNGQWSGNNGGSDGGSDGGRDRCSGGSDWTSYFGGCGR